MAPTMLEELCKRIQHCCATLRRSQNKRNVGSCWLKSLTCFKLCATTCNRVCKQTQHVTSNNVGSYVVGRQCCVRLHEASGNDLSRDTYIVLQSLTPGINACSSYRFLPACSNIRLYIIEPLAVCRTKSNTF